MSDQDRDRSILSKLEGNHPRRQEAFHNEAHEWSRTGRGIVDDVREMVKSIVRSFISW